MDDETLIGHNMASRWTEDDIQPKGNKMTEQPHESILTIAQWHEKTFPDATLKTQTEKFKDELKELSDAADTGDVKQVFFELADCAIVAAGLCRWGMAGAKAFHTVVQTVEQIELTGDVDPKVLFMTAIDQKMEINRKRKWNNDHGKYQHIETQGE